MPLVSPRNHLFSFLIPSMCLYLCLSNSLFLSLYDSLDSNNFNEECEYFQWIVVQEQYETLKKILNILLRYINYLQTVLFLYIMTLFFIRKWVENAHLQGQGQLFLSPRSIYIYFTLEHDTSLKPSFQNLHPPTISSWLQWASRYTLNVSMLETLSYGVLSFSIFASDAPASYWFFSPLLLLFPSLLHCFSFLL